MKRHGELYAGLCEFENLRLAARKAQRGKRLRPNVASFNFDLETELVDLHEELLTRTYRPGVAREFYIHEPKLRLISAAPYRDRIVHHALCNVIEPIFETTFIAHSYACRRGKGTHAAVTRLQRWMQCYPYALKCDLRRYFPNIDHELLKGAIRRKIKCPGTLGLAESIIDHANDQSAEPSYFAGDDLFTPHNRQRGLPIGNQTSQFFSNVYLNAFDHWMAERHSDVAYLRYVDDFIVLGHDKRQLHSLKREIEKYLAGWRLQLHPDKCQVTPVSDGVLFLGYRVFPLYRRLRADNPRRYGRRLRRLSRQYLRGQATLEDAKASVQAWIGHAQHADTFGLRGAVLGRVAFCRGRTG